MGMFGLKTPAQNTAEFVDNLKTLSKRIRTLDPGDVDLLFAYLNDVDTTFDASTRILVKILDIGSDEAAINQYNKQEPWNHKDSYWNPPPLSEAEVVEISDKLEQLAEQVEVRGPGGSWGAQMIAEDLGNGYKEQLELVIKYTMPAELDEYSANNEVSNLIRDAERLAKEPHDWPQIDQPFIKIIVHIEADEDQNNRPYLVLHANDQEIYRRPTWAENGDHVITVCRELRNAYKGRIQDIQIADGADYFIVMDDPRGYAKIKKAFRPLRRDYQRGRIAAGTKQ